MNNNYNPEDNQNIYEQKELEIEKFKTIDSYIQAAATLSDIFPHNASELLKRATKEMTRPSTETGLSLYAKKLLLEELSAVSIKVGINNDLERAITLYEQKNKQGARLSINSALISAKDNNQDITERIKEIKKTYHDKMPNILIRILSTIKY